MPCIMLQYIKNSGNNCLNCNFFQLKVVSVVSNSTTSVGSELPQMMKFPLKDNKVYMSM